MQMVRTSFLLTPALHQRLVLYSKRNSKSVSDVARELFTEVLADKEQTQVERTYAALDALKGMGDPKITDASTTIDDVLYGERGVWKGQNA